MTNLIRDRLKGITQLQNSIDETDLEYSAERKIYDKFIDYLSLIIFLRDIFEENLSIEDIEEE